ncbi:glycosyl hydrolase family 88 [Niveispirillum lacus]|uniref:Glycosyl hydrolase family 88 n=2 Tax=Niveispirillum lacus TaxID=1981099 RepID=A0A255YRH3_9PROT|nr:glycosyl hydrolase family 88 [Niveispirillum lacus]
MLLALPLLLPPVTAVAAEAAQAPAAKAAIDTGVALARWQLARMNDTSLIPRATAGTRNPRGWEQAVFWIGMTELAEAGAPVDIKKAILDLGAANAWKPADRPYHADDHAIAQAYLWAAKHGAGPGAIEPTRRVFDHVLANPARVNLAFYVPPTGYNDAECLTRWCWCDALFMSPPAFLEMARQTGDDRYRAFALREFWATTDFLYDPAESLYYRDSRFFERRDEKQRKMFWSRGNGWVLAGLARIIPLLEPGSDDRLRIEALFKEMARKIKVTQKPDGYWPPSLLAPENSPPESSGTAFYTYAIAWGVQQGLLERREYEPVARRGWAALTLSLQPDGRLGWVQQVSDRPEQVEPQDTQYYGVGAFLLAAAAMSRL